jgi:hypothetical protein
MNLEKLWTDRRRTRSHNYALSLCIEHGTDATIKRQYRTHIPLNSLTLREEHRLRVFGNRVLRRIFGPKRSGRRLEKPA